jgi:hypothetical protein
MFTDADTTALATVRSSFEDVRHAVQTAQSRLQDGGAVDLSGMDARIEQLCTWALDLPPPLARATLPDLIGLRDTVETLIEALTSRPMR